MTAKELQRIAVRVSNNCFCRHWLHFNHPQQTPWIMAIQARDQDGRIVELYQHDMNVCGMTKDGDFWIVERTNEDGTPFTSLL